MQLIIVDFPEPFGPMTARISLSRICMFTASTAVSPPNFFVRAMVSSIMAPSFRSR